MTCAGCCLPPRWRRHDVFLDLGAGKGRMLLAASRYPFRRVIGVELSDRLAAIARSNVAAFRLRARSGRGRAGHG